MREYQTPNGKKVVIYPVPNAFKIMFSPGGELPEELIGNFTSEYMAEKVIKAYLAKQEDKVNRGESQKRKAD